MLTPATQLTGAAINKGSPLPVTLARDLGDNVWLVGLVDGPLKMVKIRITGAATSTWLATRYDYPPSPTCKEQATFGVRCFKGTDSKNSYPVSLSAAGRDTARIWGFMLADFDTLPPVLQRAWAG